MAKLLRRILPEAKEQQAVISWARGMVPYHRYEDLALLYMVNNGNYGGEYRMWNWLLSMGLLPGLPDLHLPVARGGYFGWWWEAKRKDFNPNRKATKARERQLEMQVLLRQQGHFVLDGVAAQEAEKSLEWYIKQPPTTLA